MNRVSPTVYRFLSLFIPGLFFIYQGLLTDLLAGVGPKSQVGIEITVKETSMVQSSRIFLQDIADIKADGFLKETLGKIDFGLSPKPGKIRFIDKEKIISAIRRERYLPEDSIITCPDRIYVKRRSEQISVLDIRKYVEQRLSEGFENREFHLITFNVRGLEPYPSGEIRFISGSEDMVDKNGKLSLFVDIVINGKKTDRVSVTGLVALHETVLLAKHAFEKGETLSKESVYTEKKNIFELGDGYIQSIDAIEGKQLASAVRQGECITASLVVSPPLVQKGDIVSLVAQNESLLIVTKGICKEDGFENDVIKIENLNSGKIIRGKIKDKSKVEVIY
ncbi:MAG: flagella basal body P-ring formation protein FlgA [Desulfobacula sp. RIFOXYA12_FULL_46_16]|nr:MAG: flagella basal body P-ring formation protein FlgA [Desulfobacula sp. RIFOXYA12_FULL_46_16]